MDAGGSVAHTDSATQTFGRRLVASCPLGLRCVHAQELAGTDHTMVTATIPGGLARLANPRAMGDDILNKVTGLAGQALFQRAPDPPWGVGVLDL